MNQKVQINLKLYIIIAPFLFDEGAI